MYSAENPGKIEAVPWYANNGIFLQEVRFSVPASEWNKFLNSDLYRELELYVDSLEFQDSHTENDEENQKNEDATIAAIGKWWMNQGKYSEERIHAKLGVLKIMVLTNIAAQALLLLAILFLP